MKLPKEYITTCGWLQSETSANDVVISSRIRLARNIDGIPFSQWASSGDLKRIAEQSIEAIQHSQSLGNSDIFSIEELDSMDRHFLAEQYIISQELAKSGIERYVAIRPDQSASVMINEEDHLRIQVLIAGSKLQQAWELINAADDELENHLTFAFSNRLGYLTACPTNVGTGIRCSVMAHLPALVLSRRIEKVLTAVTQIGLTVRGFSGEGSEIAGNLFQISNQWTLGISENETIQKINKILDNVIEQEKKAQEQLMENKRISVEDRVWRAYSALRYARVMSSNEAIEFLSSIRLGRSVGILEKPSFESLNQMMIQIRPAHLQKRIGKSLEPVERDEYRAELLRDWIANGNSV